MIRIIPAKVLGEYRSYQSQTRRLRFISLRWLLLLFFIVGYFITWSHIREYADYYLGMSAMTLVFLALLLSRLDRPIRLALPVWLILAFYLAGYYLQFYWMLLDPDFFFSVHWGLPSLISSSQDVLRAYTTVSYSFVLFCITGWVALGTLPRTVRTRRIGSFVRTEYRTVSLVLCLLVPVLMVLTTAAVSATGIAVMGAESVQLPFRLAGVIYYSRGLIPALLALLVWTSDEAGLGRRTVFGLALALLYGLSDILLRSSRGALLSLFLLLFVLFVISGHLSAQRIRLFASVLLLTIFAFPLVTAYRWIRAANISSGADLGQVMAEVLGTSSASSASLLGAASIGAQSVILRLNGMSSLLPIVSSDLAPIPPDQLGVVLGQTGTSRYLTFEILGYPPQYIGASAPSLLGWMYLVGGNELVLLGTVVFVLASWLIWRYMSLLRLRSLPVVQALFIMFIFSQLSEGTIDGIGLQMVSTAVSMATCELLVRRLQRRPPKRRVPEGDQRV